MGTNIETSLKKRTIYFDRVFWQEGFALAGPKELKGKLGDKFDFTLINDKFDQDTFEKAERKMFETALDGLLAKSKKLPIEIDVVLGGDLLNQCVSTSFAMRKSSASFLGLYNACGTYAESMILGAALVDKFLDNAVCVSGSHFSSAERQYRYPLELGVLRSPMTQWTCTGVGCSLLSREKSENAPRIVSATMGRVIDFGIKDVNNMGAAMAPAAASTLLHYFKDTNTEPQEFDCIYTGDLGQTGSQLLRELLAAEGLLVRNHVDCGCILFDPNEQRVKSGGSGPGCCASVLCGHILPRLEKGTQKRVLFIATGALMSQTTFLQKESIPAIAHLVELRSPQQKEENG